MVRATRKECATIGQHSGRRQGLMECLLFAPTGPTRMSPIRPLSGAKRTSTGARRTIAIY